MNSKTKHREIKLFITEDGSHSLQVPSLDETYHSSHGAIQESQHVFIKNGLHGWIEKNKQKKVNIFEVGFGTGLNALLTTLAASELGVKVNYQSIELYPLANEIFSNLNYSKLLGCDQVDFERLHTSKWEMPLTITTNLTLHKTEASFQNFEPACTYDLIYFDAFAPSKQPDMWSYQMIEKCFNMLNTNGVFVTYSAKGQLKRDLRQAGFSVESLPGPPGKFEMVRAVKMDSKN